MKPVFRQKYRQNETGVECARIELPPFSLSAKGGRGKSCERCVCGASKGSSVVGIWHSERFGTSGESLLESNEAMIQTSLLSGTRLFYTSLPLEQWKQVRELKEELRQGLERHVRSLTS